MSEKKTMNKTAKKTTNKSAGKTTKSCKNCK